MHFQEAASSASVEVGWGGSAAAIRSNDYIAKYQVPSLLFLMNIFLWNNETTPPQAKTKLTSINTKVNTARS